MSWNPQTGDLCCHTSTGERWQLVLVLEADAPVDDDWKEQMASEMGFERCKWARCLSDGQECYISHNELFSTDEVEDVQEAMDEVQQTMALLSRWKAQVKGRQMLMGKQIGIGANE
jgi:hypothetical protein